MNDIDAYRKSLGFLSAKSADLLDFGAGEHPCCWSVLRADGGAKKALRNGVGHCGCQMCAYTGVPVICAHISKIVRALGLRTKGLAFKTKQEKEKNRRAYKISASLLCSHLLRLP